MSKVGNITFHKADFAEGVVRTRTIKLNIRLYAIKGTKQSETHPDFEVKELLQDGDEVQIGNGWHNITQNGANTGKKYISLSMDDPSFPMPVDVKLFAVSEGSKDYDVVWNRPRGKAA